jgi:RNase adaptor protein for sRNA GlmZ degradation
MIWLKAFACTMMAVWILVMVAMALALVQRRREVRRMHQLRKDNSMEFGVADGLRFERCTTCGHVRDA